VLVTGSRSVTTVAVTAVAVAGHRGATVVCGRTMSQVTSGSHVQQESGKSELRNGNIKNVIEMPG